MADNTGSVRDGQWMANKPAQRPERRSRILSSAILAGLSLLCGVKAEAFQVRTRQVAVSANALSLEIHVKNTTSAVAGGLLVKYFVDAKEHASSMVYELDYASVPGTQVAVATVEGTIQEAVLNLGSFQLKPGEEKIFKTRLHLVGWQAMDFTNDFSYAGIGSGTEPNNRVALLQNGGLVFGSSPFGAATMRNSDVQIISPRHMQVVRQPEVAVRWTVNGKLQAGETREPLNVGENELVRCFEANCASILVEYDPNPVEYPEGVAVAAGLQMPGYSMVGLEKITIGARTKVSGGFIGSNGLVEIGIDAAVRGGTFCKGNLVLKDRAKVEGDVKTSGAVSKGSQSSILGTSQEGVALEELAFQADAFATGGSNLSFTGTAGKLEPGMYGSIVVAPGAVLRVSPGEYFVQKLTVGSDAKLLFSSQAGGLPFFQVHVGAELRAGDRVHIEREGGYPVDRIQIVSLQTTTLSLGTDAWVEGVWKSLSANVQLGDRTHWKGSLVARSISIAADGTFDNPAALAAILDRVGSKHRTTTIENAKVTTARGDLFVADRTIGKMKKVRNLPIWGGMNSTYLDIDGYVNEIIPMVEENSSMLANFLDEAKAISGYGSAVLQGEDIVDGVSCWKLAISNFQAPWYLLAFYPEQHLALSKAKVWVDKLTNGIKKVEMTVYNGNVNAPVVEGGNDQQVIGEETYVLKYGPCGYLPIPRPEGGFRHLRVRVKNEGLADYIGFAEAQWRMAGQSYPAPLEGPSASNSSLFTAERIQPGLEPQPVRDGWTVFDGDWVGGGFYTRAKVGEFVFALDLGEDGGAAPDEFRMASGANGGAAPTSLVLEGSQDGQTWTKLFEREGLQWADHELKRFPLDYNELSQACIPQTLDISIKGLTLSAGEKALVNQSLVNADTPEARQEILASYNEIMAAFPSSTEEERKALRVVQMEFQKSFFKYWHSLRLDVKRGMAAGGSGTRLDLGFMKSAPLPREFFAPHYQGTAE